MFTGIVEELGTVARVEAVSGGITALEIVCTDVLVDARVGDSISVDGCCLTVTSFLADDGGRRMGFRTELMGETLARTALGGLAAGAAVNLEPALRADARLGGHLVQGHVDGVGAVSAIEPAGGWTTMRISLPSDLSPYVVEKGSITVQGCSLTVMEVGSGQFAVGLIPHTLEVTVLGALSVGDQVNLEVDVVAKYVERLLRGGASTPYSSQAPASPTEGP